MAHNSHPNSLKNLKPLLTPDTARAAQLKSAESRRANNIAREKLKVTIKQFKEFKESLEDEPVGAIDILRILMMKALDAGDDIQAADLAKSLAEFESPKLSRIDQTNTELTVDELTDEELDRQLKEILKPN
jgi:hypothetical protein|tara:strand:- start:845 stop:1237 length:393 start_codon:yes stop_codon:yes gene_type:complete